ncbi:MAG: hypothetical protein BZY88_04890 [SAR202 cluster bacterium Io17-Chloro-G9]|nr:MAG: hypothetical protein BZY88_04890 [SAR202 cluster bacterium Io17-Chloro-G9]
MGEQSIPDVPVKLNVKDFGAVGDGIADDSQAFLRAIDAIEDGAIFIPPGRYKITQVLKITKSNVVFRGAGTGETVLWMPKHLEAVLGPQNGDSDTSYYSYGRAGFITVEGSIPSSDLADVEREASRGDTSLVLESTAGIKPGQMVLLYQTDLGDGSYLKHLHGDQLEGGNYSGPNLIRFASRVEEIQGNTILLERPLRTDVRPEWGAEIREFNPTVSEVGIESLTMEFPDPPYPGHHDSLGHNAVYFEYVTDSWVRDVKFINADNGIQLRYSHFSTVEGVYFESDKGREADIGWAGLVNGHHGVDISRSDDNLFTDFEFANRFVHDIGLFAGSSGNVFSNGKGVDINFDHHRKAPIENLFTNIDLGTGARPWYSGGNSTYQAPHSGARETFWNIRAQTPLGWPQQQTWDDEPWGPDQLNLVGITTTDGPIFSTDGKWFETIAPQELFPPNLHLAQLAKRLRKQATTGK